MGKTTECQIKHFPKRARPTPNPWMTVGRKVQITPCINQDGGTPTKQQGPDYIRGCSHKGEKSPVYFAPPPSPFRGPEVVGATQAASLPATGPGWALSHSIASLMMGMGASGSALARKLSHAAIKCWPRVTRLSLLLSLKMVMASNRLTAWMPGLVSVAEP
eukprot:1159646-Pelagomonas_calceolata.AAC.5